MQIYLPIAEMAVPAELILLLGTLVGFFSGVFGIGGGFLATPFLIFMGISPAVAVGTQANQLVAASLSGVLGYLKRGLVDVRLGTVMMGGSFLGTIVGVFIFRILQHIGQINLAIPLLYIGFLGLMGALMLIESLMTVLGKKPEEKDAARFLSHPFFVKLPYRIHFPHSNVHVSALVPAGIGFVSGLLVSIMGIGGGFLLIPAMIYVLGVPASLVAGTSLFQIMFSAVISAIMHAVTNHTVDIVLAVLLMVGGVIGAQVGVKVGRRIKGVYARIILSLLLLIISSKLAGELFIQPVDLYSVELR